MTRESTGQCVSSCQRSRRRRKPDISLVAELPDESDMDSSDPSLDSKDGNDKRHIGTIYFRFVYRSRIREAPVKEKVFEQWPF